MLCWSCCFHWCCCVCVYELHLFCVPFVLFNAHNHLQDIDQMSRYVSPVNPAVYPHLSVTLLSIGLFFMAWFFVYPCSKLHMHTFKYTTGTQLLFAIWISSLNLVHWICLSTVVGILELVHMCSADYSQIILSWSQILSSMSLNCRESDCQTTVVV